MDEQFVVELRAGRHLIERIHVVGKICAELAISAIDRFYESAYDIILRDWSAYVIVDKRAHVVVVDVACAHNGIKVKQCDS